MSFYHTKKNDKMLPFMSTEKDIFLCDIYILNQKRPNQYCATRSLKTFVMYSKKTLPLVTFPLCNVTRHVLWFPVNIFSIVICILFRKTGYNSFLCMNIIVNRSSWESHPLFLKQPHQDHNEDMKKQDILHEMSDLMIKYCRVMQYIFLWVHYGNIDVSFLAIFLKHLQTILKLSIFIKIGKASYIMFKENY